MSVERIFCIGKNYADHVAELAPLGPAPDGDCVVFMKPPSCIVDEGEPVVLPRGIGAIHHEAELVVLLTGGGRDIAVDEALDCIAGITLGLDLTARDLQTQLKNKGAPWELAKAFDGAAPLGDFKPYLEQDLQKQEFTLHVNGSMKKIGSGTPAFDLYVRNGSGVKALRTLNARLIQHGGSPLQHIKAVMQTLRGTKETRDHFARSCVPLLCRSNELLQARDLGLVLAGEVAHAGFLDDRGALHQLLIPLARRSAASTSWCARSSAVTAGACGRSRTHPTDAPSASLPTES